MTLIARAKKGPTLAAKQAFRKETYFCLECNGKLRLRKGGGKQPHFYHIDRSEKCRSSQKSLEHLLTQNYFLEAIGHEKCQLERAFPSIQRIADVCWEEKKVIFEIQCSPISSEELESRNRDYKSVGYQVIWIFHEKRFNRFRLSGAERSMVGKPFYFSNIDEKGRGFIYDQLSFIEWGCRKKRTKKIKINPSKVFPLQQPNFTLPIELRKRIENFAFCFEGELLSSIDQPETENFLNDFFPKKELKPLKKRLIESTLFPFRWIFHLLLERNSF